MFKKISANIAVIALVVLMTVVPAIVVLAQEVITVGAPKAVPVVVVEKEFSNKGNISITNDSYAKTFDEDYKNLDNQMIKQSAIESRRVSAGGKIYLPKSFEEASRIAELKYGINRSKQSNIKTSVIDGRTEKEVSANTAAAKPDAPKTAQGISFLASVIYHSNGKSDLSTKDLEVLSRIAKISKDKSATVQIVGHASSRTGNMSLLENKMVNYNISIERAERIKKELMNYGVSAKDISLVAVSDTEPINREIMPIAENVNRRSEIYISY